VLPFATGTIMWVMNPAYMDLLFTEQMGHKMLGAAAVSLLLGLLTIRQMFQKALSLT
jgi:tight adherence protein B